MIDIPCHPAFIDDKVVLNTNVTKSGVKESVKLLTDLQEVILEEMRNTPSITTRELAQKIDVKFRTLQRYISQLQSMGVLKREGSRKEGLWVIIMEK